MLARATLASVLLFSTAVAQTTAPASTRPHVVVETVGPDGWRARLGPTNLGTLLASEQGRGYWQPMTMPLFGMWQHLVGDADTFDAARTRLLGYSGTIRVAMRLVQDGPDAGSPSALAIVLDADGRTDLPALGKDVELLLERGGPGQWQEVPRDGAASLRLRAAEGFGMSAPYVDGGKLVVVGGLVPEIQGALGLATQLMARPATIGTAAPGSPALRVHLHMPELLAPMFAEDDREAHGMRALGMACFDEITVDVAAAGPHVTLGVDVGFTDAARGIWGAFMPATRGVSPLRALVPDATSLWKVGRLDCRTFADAVLRAIDAWQRNDDGEARTDCEKALGVDLLDGLLAHMTDELLVIGAPFEGLDRATEASWVVAWRLHDDAKFAAALDTALEQGVKPLLMPAETADVDGAKLRRYGNMIDYDLWIGTGNGLFVLAAGRDAEEEATRILKAGKQLGAGAAEDAPAGFDDLKKHLPSGLNGVSLGDLDAVAGLPLEWWFELFDALTPMHLDATADPEEAEAAVEQFRDLLRKNRLTRIRTATGHADGRWRWRLYW